MPIKPKQSDNYKFRVIREEVIRNGVRTGFWGNYREDNGACLGMTSEDYRLVQNDELVDAAMLALENRGLNNFKSRFIVTGEGERFYAEFSFQDKTLASQVGDVFGYRLTLKNSFDLTSRWAISLGFLRLICSNGAATTEREFSHGERHKGKVSVDAMGKAIDAALAHGQDALKVYDELANAAVDDEQGKNVLAHLERSDILSGVIREAAEKIWLHPTYDADKARNLGNLYNAVTQHLTHGVSGTRFEYADKVSTRVLFRLLSAARNRSTLDKLIVPVPTDTAIVVAVN